MRTGFLQFIVDSKTRQLLSDGKELHLSTKAFDLLCVLIGSRPDVVGKEELLTEIWPDSHVSEANLNVLVGEVRRALGDSAQKPQCIRTVHGVGFAFCAAANDLEKESPEDRVERSSYWLVAKQRRFVLSEGENVIGRDPACSVWIDDPDVSRRHARIHIDGSKQRAVLTDLNSTNGTHIGRSRVKTEKTLHDGDIVKVGPVELTFRDASGAQQTRRIRRRSSA